MLNAFDQNLELSWPLSWTKRGCKVKKNTKRTDRVSFSLLGDSFTIITIMPIFVATIWHVKSSGLLLNMLGVTPIIRMVKVHQESRQIKRILRPWDGALYQLNSLYACRFVVQLTPSFNQPGRLSLHLFDVEASDQLESADAHYRSGSDHTHLIQ